VNQISEAPPIGVIEPPRGWVRPDFGEVWRHRDILYFLVRRDVALHYKQTLIGATWAVLRPALLAAVFSLFLGLFLDADYGDVPLPAFVFASITLWLFFSEAFASCAESTTKSTDLISRIYFPRLIIPIAALLPPLADLGISLIVVFVVLALYGITPEVQVLLLPAVVVLALATSFGAGLWLSALAVRFRDVHLVVPFLLLILMFSGCVFAPLSELPEKIQTVYSINPLVGIMEGYRWVMLGAEAPNLLVFPVIPMLVSTALIVTGLFYFARAERGFADVI
jgi:lipopolysaccharide transport system permease protein